MHIDPKTGNTLVNDGDSYTPRSPPSAEWPAMVTPHSSWIMAIGQADDDGLTFWHFFAPDYPPPLGTCDAWIYRQAHPEDNLNVLGTDGRFLWYFTVQSLAEANLVQAPRIPTFALSLSDFPSNNAQPSG